MSILSSPPPLKPGTKLEAVNAYSKLKQGSYFKLKHGKALGTGVSSLCFASNQR